MTYDQMSFVLSLLEAEKVNPTGLSGLLKIRYTNWRGETADRVIRPIGMRFAWTEWHPKPQWLLDATDIEKDAERSFAVRDIQSWLPGGKAEPEK